MLSSIMKTSYLKKVKSDRIFVQQIKSDSWNDRMKTIYKISIYEV